jgi:glutamate-ammonia-ligase adenylyltransferase
MLETLGEPEPSRAADALGAAARHPDLAPSRGEWLPGVLLTARPGFAARCLLDLAARHREMRRRPLDLLACPTLPHVLGSSDFLARLLLRHPNWVDDLVGDLPSAPPEGPIDPDWTPIRVAKYRGLLRIAARDLCDRPFQQGLEELTALADRCLEAALRCAATEESVPAPALLALGKLGGSELNFSSDVDLLFLYRAPPEQDDLEHNAEMVRLVQTFKRHLEARSDDGFGYRVDLDLRPEGRSGTLANSVEAALGYYETFGAEWERQMLIRVRALAGPADAADAFLNEIMPFIYRSLIDPGAIRAVRDMKARIEAERRTEGRDLEYDLKEGPGGIRDVEFLVQALQLFHGGRHDSIRTGNVLCALRALAEAGLLPEEAAEGLRSAYIWLRRAEHALQMVEERQTHAFPRDRAAQVGLARRLGYRDEEADTARDRLLEDWTNTRAEVRGHFEALILTTEE